jgi:hypothetical protein
MAVTRRRLACQHIRRERCHPTSLQLWFHGCVEELLSITLDIKGLLGWLCMYPRLIKKHLHGREKESLGQRTLDRYF